MCDKFYNNNIKKLNPYAPPIFEKEGIRLYMNENIFGASPKCLEVLKRIEMKNLTFYSYGKDTYIKNILIEKLNIKEENICFNNGSASSIQQICSALINENDRVLVPNPGWSYYKTAILACGGIVEEYDLDFEEKEIKFNIEKIIKKVIETKAKVLFINSPNMPTGNIISENEVIYLLSTLKETVIVLDEAYYGFSNIKLNIEKLVAYKNFLCIRTFSKYYGLASLRVGYILGYYKLINELIKIAPLFGISYIAQLIAGEALKDDEYYFELKSKLIEIRNYFIGEINKIQGYYAYDSKSNFILIDVKKHNPSEIITKLKSKGYLVRDCKGYKLFHHIRITVGTIQQMNEILNILKKFNE